MYDIKKCKFSTKNKNINDKEYKLTLRTYSKNNKIIVIQTELNHSVPLMKALNRNRLLICFGFGIVELI